MMISTVIMELMTTLVVMQSADDGDDGGDDHDVHGDNGAGDCDAENIVISMVSQWINYLFYTMDMHF